MHLKVSPAWRLVQIRQGEEAWSSNLRSYAAQIVQKCIIFRRIVRDAATCGGTLIYKHDETTSFPPSLFPFLFFLLVALALACDKPVGPSPCAKQRNYFSSLSPSSCVGAQQNAWPGNRFVKCADAYIVRRKCRIQVSANLQDFVKSRCQWRWLHSQWKDKWLLIKINKIVGPRRVISFGIVWDAATCGGTLNYQHDEPTSFFFFIPIEAAHRRLPRRPSLLGGGVAATKLEQGIRKDRL